MADEIIRPDESTLLPEFTDTAPTPEPEFEEGDYVPAPSREPGHRVNPHHVRRMPVEKHQRMSPLRPLMAARTTPVAGSAEPASRPAVIAVPQPAGLRDTTWATMVGGVGGVLGGGLIGVSPLIPFFVRNDQISLYSAATGYGNAYILFLCSFIAVISGGVVLIAGRHAAALVANVFLAIAGVVSAGMAYYLLLLTEHRRLIDTGYDYGPAAWVMLVGILVVLIAATLAAVGRTGQGYRA